MMNVSEILSECNKLFIVQFENPAIVIKRDTTMNDVEGWDSLTYILLINAIEKHFKIKFLAAEIMGFKNVGDMCDSIQKKLA